MNQWYKSSFTKGMLVLAAHILCIVMSISLLFVSGCTGIAAALLTGEKIETYEESKDFGQQIWYDASHTFSMKENQVLFDKNGKIKKDIKIDLLEYHQTGKILQENKSGLFYRLEDFAAWSEDSGSDFEETENIIVCQKPDGTYNYYYFAEIEKLLNEKKIQFDIRDIDDTMDYSADGIKELLRSGQLYEAGYDARGVQIIDEKGNPKYASFWNYSEELTRAPAPEGYDSILAFVNEDARWNGNLQEVHSILYDTAQQLSEAADIYSSNTQQWQEGDTNLSYMYVDFEAGSIFTNKSEFQNIKNVDVALEKMKSSGKYAIIRPKLSNCETNINGIDLKEWKYEVKEKANPSEDFLYVVQMDTKYPIQDGYYQQSQIYDEYGSKIKSVLLMGLSSLLGFIIILMWLTVISGRRVGDKEIHLQWFDRWKTELAAILMGLPICFLAVGGVYIGAQSYTVSNYGYYKQFFTIRTYEVEAYIIFALVAFSLCAVSLVAYLSLVRRIKAKTLWKNSLLRSICSFIKKVIVNRSAIWKDLLIFGLFVLLHWMVMSSGGASVIVFIMLGSELAVAVYLVYRAIGQKIIMRGLERIAGGEVNYQIPLEKLRGEQLVMAKRINSIGVGLDAALETSMKNERMKTDLITNVSHDIKTPLTSIINYVDLLKRENFTDPKINGYLDILEAKAQRLKTLTEDVVEASKVSSGTITLEYMNINLVEMIQQTSGEFEEKFAKRNLTEVLTLPDEEIIIHADGRRIWRVLENIYNNAAKYAMEGTRIYADIQASREEVVFVLKNVSDQPLNISADELTERFIRGDVSRSTEGSGLGLSIAKNLVEMQGGRFETYVDGDLFRVTMIFSRRINTEGQK